jgi:hypothetical protein
MSVTFTAVAGRNYKLSYFEPGILLPTVSGGAITGTIRFTNAAGGVYQTTYLQNNSATAYTTGMFTNIVTTVTAGSVTLVGCLVTSSISGTPTATRTASQLAYLLVEDIGTA